MADVNDVVNWIADRLYKFRYSQIYGRLDPERTGYTDCSALIIYAYKHVMGVDLGVYTGTMLGKGSVVFDESENSVENALSKLKRGDLVFFNWSYHNTTYDHVEIYEGNGYCLSHGGPGNGPQRLPFRSEWRQAYEIRAIRPIASDAPVVQRPVDNSMGDWPFPLDHYVGDINGPEESHGGFYASEREFIKGVQRKLWYLGYGQGLSLDDFADGLFEVPWSTNAAAQWQRDHMPGTEFYGQIWADDYAKLRSM